MLVPVTVHVPEHLVPGFYSQFATFLSGNDSPAGSAFTPGPPTVLESGDRTPAWVDSEDAPKLASALWNELSGPGQSVLLYMSRAAKKAPYYFQPDELADGMNHPNGASGIAGILGGVGKAIKRAGLPEYAKPRGGTWHYIWDWNGATYTMTPPVSRLLIAAHHRR